MRTVELMIVFGALMAIVAVVAIAIDWVGKPLRGRRFIPRVYRFDDELGPDAPLSHHPAPLAPMPMPKQMPVGAAFPIAATPAAPASAVLAQPAGAFSNSLDTEHGAGEAAASSLLNPTVLAVPAVLDPSAPPDVLEQADEPIDDWEQLLDSTPNTAMAGADLDATQDWGGGPPKWDISMPLDAIIGAERPSLTDKAERYWKTIASSAMLDADTTHFDGDHISRMLDGRAPSRLNPRTGRSETPELIGLRSASEPAQVQLFWPGESIDPWSAR